MSCSVYDKLYLCHLSEVDKLFQQQMEQSKK